MQVFETKLYRNRDLYEKTIVKIKENVYSTIEDQECIR